jgi:NAD(P)H-dependent flavin oxidoreductase YrpB (nitropropane dioxygenase family)
MALGCAGVWCGSIWLKTEESEVIPEIKEKLFAADATDSVLTRAVTGKPCRTLRSAFTDAYEQPGAPSPLPAPLQNILWWAEGRTRAERVRKAEFLTYPVGQVVGNMTETISVRQVIYDIMEEFIETQARLQEVLE